jgi:hypothetical protein
MTMPTTVTDDYRGLSLRDAVHALLGQGSVAVDVEHAMPTTELLRERWSNPALTGMQGALIIDRLAKVLVDARRELGLARLDLQVSDVQSALADLADEIGRARRGQQQTTLGGQCAELAPRLRSLADDLEPF